MQQSVSVFAQTMNHYICPVWKYTANSIEFIRQTAFIGSLFLIRMSWAPMKIGQSQDRSEIISVEKSFVFFILFVKKIEMVLISDILYTTERLKKLNYFVCLPSWHTHTQNKEFKMHFNPNYWINWIKSMPKKEIRTVNKKNWVLIESHPLNDRNVLCASFPSLLFFSLHRSVNVVSLSNESHWIACYAVISRILWREEKKRHSKYKRNVRGGKKDDFVVVASLIVYQFTKWSGVNSRAKCIFRWQNDMTHEQRMGQTTTWEEEKNHKSLTEIEMKTFVSFYALTYMHSTRIG